MTRIGIGYKKGAKIARFERALQNPVRALKQIGALAVSESQAAFRAQRLGRDTWKPRAEVNRFGIIADFHAGKSEPPSRRFQTRPALRDTGRLASSIAFRVDHDSVVIGSNLPYASVHHTGGEVESMPITEDVQSRLADWLKGQNSERRKQLGHLLNKNLTGTTLKMEVPERPIVALTDQLIADVREVVGVEIFEVR